MENAMVPAGGSPGGTLAVQQKGIVAPSQDMMGGGGGFSETWSINKDRHVFVNKKTQEERKELYVIIEEMHPNRALFPKQGPQKGERVCYSDDGKSSYQGIECVSCPRVSEVDAFNKYYEAHPGQQRPQFIGDCSLRYSIYWTKEFVVSADGAVTMQVHKDRVLFNGPKSSVYAMWGRGNYKAKLDQQGLDITKVVTRIKIAQRENPEMKSIYDYGDFELVGTIESIMPKVVKTVQIESTPSSAPAASFPGQPASAALPQMAGTPAPQPGFPATAGFPASAPAAAPGFPPATAPGFPQAAAPAPVAPGFPAAAPAQATVAVAPGFPGMAQPNTVTNGAPAPAPQTTTANPTFQDFAAQAKAKLIQDFHALGGPVQAVVLNVLGVTKIEDVPNEKVIQASQAVNSAKGFSPAPAAAGAVAGNPF